MSISDRPTEAQIKTTLRALDIALINGIRYPLFDEAAKVIRWLQVCVSGANHDAEARRVAIEALTEGRGLDDEGLWAMLKEERDAAKARVAELERQLSMLDPAPLVNSLRAEIDEAVQTHEIANGVMCYTYTSRKYPGVECKEIAKREKWRNDLHELGSHLQAMSDREWQTTQNAATQLRAAMDAWLAEHGKEEGNEWKKEFGGSFVLQDKKGHIRARSFSSGSWNTWYVTGHIGDCGLSESVEQAKRDAYAALRRQWPEEFPA